MGTVHYNYIGTIELSDDCVNECHHMGDCEEDCKRWMEELEVKAQLDKIDPDNLRKELYEFGAWYDDELLDHNENLMRILWIAARDIQDQKYDY